MLTNSPNLPEQLAWYNEWKNNQTSAYGASGQVMNPGFCGLATNISNFNGSGGADGPVCNGISRFTTLAMLKSGIPPYPSNLQKYPLSPSNSSSLTQVALTQAVMFLNWVTIPSAWPANNFTTYEELSLMQYVRDHVGGIMYVRPAQIPQIFKFNVTSILASKASQSPLVPSVVDWVNIVTVQTPFYVDVTASMT